MEQAVAHRIPGPSTELAAVYDVICEFRFQAAFIDLPDRYLWRFAHELQDA